MIMIISMMLSTQTQIIKVCMIMLSIFLKKHSDQQVDKDNGFYTQTSLMNGDSSYVEVTGEGPEGFVLDIQKQTENDK